MLRGSPRGAGPLLDAIASAGYESPTRNYLRIDEAISGYLAGNRRPYRRLTAPADGGYGNYRYYSRGDELTVSCNDYPMLWDKEAGAAERGRQLDANVAAYPRREFAPFTPREVALESSAGYLECLAWPQPSPLYEPPAPARAPRPRMPTLVISGSSTTSPAPARAGRSCESSQTPARWSSATAATYRRCTVGATPRAIGCAGSSPATEPGDLVRAR